MPVRSASRSRQCAWLRAALGPDVPLIETVFTPLAILGEMVEAPERAERAHPRAARAGARRARSGDVNVRAPGASGHRGRGGRHLPRHRGLGDTLNLLTPDEHRRWARPYDLRLLEAARGAPFNVLHVCKRRNLLFEMSDYPVGAFSWDANDSTNPTLAAALARLRGAVMGGISFDTSLATADPGRFTGEYRRALEATGGRRWLAAPGCSIPPGTAPQNLEAVRDAVLATRLKETPLS